MPEGERGCNYDPDEQFPWDFDNDTYSESEVFDLLLDEEK